MCITELLSSHPALIEVLDDTVNSSAFILLYMFLFLSCCYKCLPKMPLKRVLIGAMFTTTSAFEHPLDRIITSWGHHESNERVPCMMTLNPCPITSELEGSIDRILLHTLFRTGGVVPVCWIPGMWQVLLSCSSLVTELCYCPLFGIVLLSLFIYTILLPANTMSSSGREMKLSMCISLRKSTV